jgi:citron Rho-interacting kinase
VVNRLEEVIRSSPHNLSVPQHGLPEGSTRRLVCSLPPPQEVLAAAKVGERLVLGTTQGLACLTPEGVTHCQGIDTPVHRLHHLASLNLLVLATGGDGLPSQLVVVSSLSLTSPLHPTAVTPELARCHTFACLETNQGKVFLCAVSEDLVVILEWSARRGSFVLRNKFSTDQPTAAIHFTDHSVLVGTTKFYEIDLKNFSAEEFLDLAHPGIKETVSSPAFNGSLPKSVLKLDHEDGEPEYLLAFTRNIVFVDSFGQETRSPLLLERMPLEHRLVGQILATSYCDTIEFRDLESESEPSLVTAASPHLLATVDGELLFSHQDTASNNLAGVRIVSVTEI